MERRREKMPEFFVKAQERGFQVEPLGAKALTSTGRFVFNGKRAGTT
jgi:hypothetical protein